MMLEVVTSSTANETGVSHVPLSGPLQSKVWCTGITFTFMQLYLQSKLQTFELFSVSTTLTFYSKNFVALGG